MNPQDYVLSAKEIKNALAQFYPELAHNYIECFETIDSTNTYAKTLAAQNASKYHQAIITAESQTAGRGRIGRTFESPAGTGVYLSLIITPQGGITQPAVITASAAVAVCRAIKKLYSVQPAIKWINDIYVQNDGMLKKAVGILTEGVTNSKTGQIDSAVIGIGVNIKPSEKIKNSDAKNIAGFLTEAPQIDGRNQSASLPSRAQFISEIAGQVFSIFNEDKEKVIAEYKSLTFLIGKELTVYPLIGDDKTAYKATAVNIDKNAALVVQLPDGTQKALNSGEVTLHNSKN